MAEPNRTESATPRKREDARKRGQVARSIELNSALGLLGVLALFHFIGGYMLRELEAIARYAWGNLSQYNLSDAEFRRWAFFYILKFILILGPLLLGVFIIGILTNAIQFGFLFTTETLSPKPENLNPTKGFKRIFSRRTAVELFKAVIKISALGLTTWFTLHGRLPEILNMLNSDVGGFISQMAALTGLLFLRLALVLLVLALLDYAYQRWEYEESIKMTKQEVKDEFRQLEGDPQIKSRIRQLQREASRRRMLADLPKADVVITNPTHLAVAVRYDGLSMDAPMVIAKGARLMAERIKKAAKENGIPVMENKPLARELYANCPVGSAVPGSLFSAVAELLAYVYQVQGTLAQKAEQNRRRIYQKTGKLPDVPVY